MVSDVKIQGYLGDTWSVVQEALTSLVHSVFKTPVQVLLPAQPSLVCYTKLLQERLQPMKWTNKSSLEHVSLKEKESSGLNQEVGKPRAKTNWFLLGHTSQFPPLSWFSSEFVSLTPGMWPEDFRRVKELLCSPKPSLNTRCSSSARRTYFKTNLKAEESLGKGRGLEISTSSGGKGEQSQRITCIG